ncbi:MAG: 5'-nucleotidase [Puniceicoccales bacterium]|jgi:5'-nucleotidase|nr:5'-nucleotidase [Puniceicoccales bacterium]
MPYPIDKKLVIGVSSSALFDMIKADNVFKNSGEAAYREYQQKNIDTPFSHGVAFPFIKRLLNLNKLYPKISPIEVIVLSRNDPETGRRFFRTCRHYELDITRGAFLAGKEPFSYIPAFNISLFLSANESDVKSATKNGHPAGLVLPTKIKDDDSTELRIAFDFDGVLADDEAEAIYKKTGDLELFHQYELKKTKKPHNPGPLKDLLQKISSFQELEAKKAKKDKSYKPALRISIVTARNAPSNERFVTTMQSWGINVDETFFLGGIDKTRILKILKPHIFFDDQIAHLASASKGIPSVHIPFGIANEESFQKETAPTKEHDINNSQFGLNLPL